MAEREGVLGNRVLYTRSVQHMEADELAQKSGVSLASIQEIESGTCQKPLLETMISIAEVLGVSPYYLLS